jgi:hypothetical protein
MELKAGDSRFRVIPDLIGFGIENLQTPTLKERMK